MLRVLPVVNDVHWSVRLGNACKYSVGNNYESGFGPCLTCLSWAGRVVQSACLQTRLSKSIKWKADTVGTCPAHKV